jgi:hypothetical protein
MSDLPCELLSVCSHAFTSPYCYVCGQAMELLFPLVSQTILKPNHPGQLVISPDHECQPL